MDNTKLTEEQQGLALDRGFCDKADMTRAIEEGLYLNVFRTDRLGVERPDDVIVFKL